MSHTCTPTLAIHPLPAIKGRDKLHTSCLLKYTPTPATREGPQTFWDDTDESVCECDFERRFTRKTSRGKTKVEMAVVYRSNASTANVRPGRRWHTWSYLHAQRGGTSKTDATSSTGCSRNHIAQCSADQLASSTRSCSRHPRQAGRHDHSQCGAH